jgi:lipid II:glycine glycyltransferase (peptidoglycan interpeptide bridge formation enzyme)
MAGTGAKNFSHLILKKGNEIVAAAHVRLMWFPLIKKGIAYVFWGPIWQQKEVSCDPEIFRQTIRALRNEFSRRRGLVLRIFPYAFSGKDDALKAILADEGFEYYDDGKSHRTLIIDLAPSLEEIRAALDQKWRNCLNRSEKNNLEIVSGTEPHLFDEVEKIYHEMAGRKGLEDISDIAHLRKVQRDLPAEFKLRISLCRLDGQVCAGAIFSAVGATAVYLVGATSNTGMKSNGSYLIQWSFLKWLKENGFLFYNLNGINPEINPGTYHFKRGLAGKNGMALEYLGKYQVADNLVSALLVNGGEKFVSSLKKAGKRIKSLRK